MNLNPQYIKFCFSSVYQVLRLQEEKILLKQSSEQEVGQLWTQLESMRTSRQELGGEIDTCYNAVLIYCIYFNTQLRYLKHHKYQV